MDYNVGSRVRVKLSSVKIVDAKITAIVNQSTGRQVQILFGDQTVLIDPVQIVEVTQVAE
jgi:hypothetical protein